MNIHSMIRLITIILFEGRKSMKKALICGLALAFLCSTGLVSLVMASDHGPEVITLLSTTDHARKPKPVIFPHAEHQGRLDCKICHHTKGPDGKQVAYTDGMKIEKCETCHNPTSSMPKSLNSLKKVGHKRCKGCHKKSGNKKLTKCKTCHSKKK